MRYLFTFVLFFSGLPKVLAHEEIYHLDPVLTEHAHMEYEYILGVGLEPDLPVAAGERNLLTLEAEVNYPFTEQFSAEIILGGGWLFGAGPSLGFSDLELEGRWVFYSTPRWALSVALPIELPTGDETKGLSEDRVAVEPTFRADLFLKSFDLYYNFIFGAGLSEKHYELDQRVALAYLWRVTPNVTLSPVAELRGAVEKGGHGEVDIGGGFGGAWKTWFGVVEVFKPLLSDEAPAWSVFFHIGYHKRP